MIVRLYYNNFALCFTSHSFYCIHKFIDSVFFLFVTSWSQFPYACKSEKAPYFHIPLFMKLCKKPILKSHIHAIKINFLRFITAIAVAYCKLLLIYYGDITSAQWKKDKPFKKNLRIDSGPSVFSLFTLFCVFENFSGFFRIFMKHLKFS